MVPSKPTTTRLEAEDGTTEAEQEGLSRVQIPPRWFQLRCFLPYQSLTLPLDSLQETFQGTYLIGKELSTAILC